MAPSRQPFTVWYDPKVDLIQYRFEGVRQNMTDDLSLPYLGLWTSSLRRISEGEDSVFERALRLIGGSYRASLIESFEAAEAEMHKAQQINDERVLSALKSHGPQWERELRMRLRMSSGAVSSALRRLEGRGEVTDGIPHSMVWRHREDVAAAS